MPSLEDLTTDQLLAKAREYEGMATLAYQLLANKDTRPMVQRALKKLKPELVIPELDQADALSTQLTEIRESNKELEKRLIERDVKDRVRENREAIKDKYKLTDADVAKVEALMVLPENAGMSHDAAARVYKASIAPAIPTPANFNPPTFDMPEKDVWGPGIGNPARLNKIAMNEGFKALNEIMGGKVAPNGVVRAA
jgi:hypothetical protein